MNQATLKRLDEFAIAINPVIFHEHFIREGEAKVRRREMGLVMARNERCKTIWIIYIIKSADPRTDSEFIEAYNMYDGLIKKERNRGLSASRVQLAKRYERQYLTN